LRLLLALRLLETSRKTMPQIAAEIGYESEVAPNRALKRKFGAPPAPLPQAARGLESYGRRPGP